MSEQTRCGASHVAVTPSDTADIGKLNGQYPRAVRFGTGGTATIVTPDGAAVSYTNIADGEIIDVQTRRINSTGLSGAANIVAIY